MKKEDRLCICILLNKSMNLFWSQDQRRLTFNLAYLAIFKISAILTALVAASSKSSVSTMLKPEFEIIYWASSMFVPFILKTMGFFIPKALIPLINPKAMMSALK